jgi:hypothetical protein
VAESVSCLFCGEDVRAADVAYHIWQWHVGDNACWCGNEFFRPATESRVLISNAAEFRAHCGEHGGFLAHYLECQLRGENG